MKRHPAQCHRCPPQCRPSRLPAWLLLAGLLASPPHPTPNLLAADILLHADTLSISGDDDDPDALLGAFFVAEVVDGVARFLVFEDLLIRSEDRLLGQGSRPISLFVAGHVTIEDGAIIDLSALNTLTPGPGGGSGGISRSGGAGGAGGRRGIIGDRTGGTDGGLGGGAGQGGNAPSGNGTGGGGGRYSLSGQAGQTGQAGTNGLNGTDGFQAVGSGGLGGNSGGAGGNGGAGGSGSSQTGGSGGSAGSGGFTSGGSGGSGGNATATGVDNGIVGSNGTQGADGFGGTNNGTGPTLSGGGGGGSGKGGGGGGGGGGGRNGAGGGGGGGGGAAFTVSGTNGGAGGNGGRGGAGGRGGDGGDGGAGGAGGGAFEIIALGGLTLGNATLLATGSDGDAGDLGVSGIDPGNNGEAGKAGGNVTNGAGKGGDGGDGTDGGRGAAGRDGGNGGSGGGGGGGTIKLFASSLTTSAGLLINVVGGQGGIPGLNDGAEGRILIGHNQTGPLGGTFLGSTEELPGPRLANPHLASLEPTPFLPNLLESPAPAGILKGLNAGSFPSLVAAAPPNARVALHRMDIGPTGYDQDYQGFDMLLVLNLTCNDLDDPTLGVGAQNLSAPLQYYGPFHLAEFGGSGPSPRTTLEPWCIYATLIPDNASWFTLGCSANGSPLLLSQEGLDPGQTLYLTFGQVNCPEPIPPPTHGNEDLMLLTQPRINADGKFEFLLLGPANATLQLERSFDLQTWEPIGSITLFDGQAAFVTPQRAGSGQIFFRTIKPNTP